MPTWNIDQIIVVSSLLFSRLFQWRGNDNWKDNVLWSGLNIIGKEYQGGLQPNLFVEISFIDIRVAYIDEIIDISMIFRMYIITTSSTLNIYVLNL